ncbi:hypothetical protein EC988_003563, partial [Linderina pennispora]
PSEEKTAKDARDDEGGQELIRQQEFEDKLFLQQQVVEQQQQQQRNEQRNHQFHNRAPNMTETRRIRQPARFNSGLPKETVQVMRDMKSSS